MRLAHLSDPHLSSLTGVRPRQLLGKRALGYLSWRCHKRHEHRGEVLAALAADLQRIGPDQIVVTGDLTHLGLPEEFAETGRWLRALGPPSRVTVVPGNHDVYAPTPWAETLAQWEPYLRSDAAQTAAFPSLRLRDGVALIGLSTARPSAPLLAVGSLGRAQLEALDRLLEETARCFRVVLLHHPPAPGTLSWRKRLTDAGAFAAVLARRGAELVLHGHAHRTCLAWLDTPAGRIPAVGVPSASAIGSRPGRGACYHLYDLPGDGVLRVAVRRYCSRRETFAAAGERRLEPPTASAAARAP